MSTTLHVFPNGRSFVQVLTSRVQWHMGRKYIVHKDISSHTGEGGSYVYRQVMLDEQFTVIPGSGNQETLRGSNTYAAHLPHVQTTYVYTGGVRRHRFERKPF